MSTSLVNSGSNVWTLGVPACGYSYRWTADHPSVHVIGEACMKNTFATIYLKPGEVFQREVPVLVDLAPGKGEPESVTFRLGFIESTPKIPPIWSNAVTVSVTK